MGQFSIADIAISKRLKHGQFLRMAQARIKIFS